MRKRKISDKQFTLDCINKEYEICGATDRHFETFDDLVKFANEYDEAHKDSRWFQEYHFKTLEQHNAWRDYFLEHFYDWQPKYVSKVSAENEFAWFSLSYGFMCDEYGKN